MRHGEGDDFARSGANERLSRFRKRSASGRHIIYENDVASLDGFAVRNKTPPEIFKSFFSRVHFGLASGVFAFCEREGKSKIPAAVHFQKNIYKEFTLIESALRLPSF